jgi:hypothetical protein
VDYEVCCEVHKPEPSAGYTGPPLPEVVSSRQPVTEPYDPMHPKYQQCGTRNIKGIGYRIAGADTKQAQYGELPWMTCILREDKVGRDSPVDVYVGGGALISPHLVATAAHVIVGYA